MLTAWLLFGVSLALIALCGLFVAAEFSFVTVSRTAVQCAADNGVPGAAGLGEALRSLSTQLSAAQVGITITNLLIGWVAEPSIATLLRDPMLAFGTPESAVRGISLTVALIVSTVLTMLFGELLPQNLALAHPFGVGRVVQAPQRWFTAVSRPLTLALNDLSNRIVHALGVEPQEELASARSPEELVSVVRASARSGHLAPGTADLVERSLRFDDLQAKDVLTPRTRMVWLEATDPVQRAIELGVRHGRSRFPVAGEDLDDIVGVIEVSRAVGVPPARRAYVSAVSLSEPPLFVPHTAPLDEVLWAMRDRDTELAIVLDEYGGTAGIATLEDLVEELVGEVNDEHDLASHVVRQAEGTWVVSGLLRPDELRDLTGIRLPENPQRYETVAGLVLYELGRIPGPGEELVIGDVKIRVERMDGHRVDLLWLDAPEPLSADEEDED